MNRDQLADALRAASKLLGERDFVVVGSAAILGSFPENLMTKALMISTEVDLLPPDDPTEEKAVALDGAQRELSQFHQTHGFYIDGVSVNTSRSPDGWQQRVVPFAPIGAEGAVGWCLSAVDLVATKAVAGRTKDRRFVAAALRQRLANPDTVLALIPTIDATPDRLTTAADLVDAERPDGPGTMTPQPVTDGVERALKFEAASFTDRALSDEAPQRND